MSTRSIIFSALLIVTAMFVMACNAGAARPGAPSTSSDAEKYANLQGDATKGRTAFIGTCAPCHGQEGRGVPGLGKDLTKSDFTKNLSNANFVLFLTKGRPASDPLNATKVDMPPRGGNPALKDQDLADIVAFVRTLQK